MKTKGTAAEKLKLINELLKLKEQIKNNTDPATLTALRGDYRKAAEKLELFYNDEPEPVK